MGHNEDRNRVVHYYSDHLKQKLDLIAVSPTVVVEAPTGCGKTTAVRDYLDTAFPQGADIHWFTAVDEAPVALYHRFCREIERIDDHEGKHLIKIDFPNAFTVGEACDAIRSIRCNHEVWLVIDNFRFLYVALPTSFLTALPEHYEKALHVIVISQMLGNNLTAAISDGGVLNVTAFDLRLNAADIRSYYSLAGIDITETQACQVLKYTDGWIIAVYLQLCAYQETGAFSDMAAHQLIDKLIWKNLTEEQRIFLMCVSLFETITLHQIYSLFNWTALPDYVAECLSVPLINYDIERQMYELHGILREFIEKKRAERGTSFEKRCLLTAGDSYRNDGKTELALEFYARIKDYRRILSLDLSHFIYEEIGDTTFFEIALDLAQNCPSNIRRAYPLSMLRVAWAIKSSGNDDVFGKLMKELDEYIPENGLLRAEWLLLSGYLSFPHTDQMLSAVQKAAALFGGARSQVILPEAPWAFGGFSQIAEFHIKAGEADRESESLRAFLSIYSRLTGGHGSGADELFRAELAYNRRDMMDAEIFAYKSAFLAESNQQSIVQLGVALLLADIALYKADVVGWQNAIASMERVANYEGQNNFVVRAMLDAARGTLLTELGIFNGIADWLKNGEFRNRTLIGPMLAYSFFVFLKFLYCQEDYTRFIGLMEALPLNVRNKSAYSEFLSSILIAAGYNSIGDRAKAVAFFEQAAENVMQDGLITDLISFSRPFQDIANELIEKKYPQYLARFNDCKEQYIVGWKTLNKAVASGDLPQNLTEREREIALLAAEGLHNREIAERLFVTENTVRTHLRSVFQKLDIDRRAKLSEMTEKLK